MTSQDNPASRLLATNNYPDRRAPPCRLKDHPVERAKAPSAAQRFLQAKRLNAYLDEGVSVDAKSDLPNG